MLQKYDVSPDRKSPKGKFSKRRTSRSYSHSTVDEFSGDEELVVDGTKDKIPLPENEQHKLRSQSPSEEDQGVRRILSIIAELQVRLSVLNIYRHFRMEHHNWLFRMRNCIAFNVGVKWKRFNETSALLIPSLHNLLFYQNCNMCKCTDCEGLSGVLVGDVDVLSLLVMSLLCFPL